MLWLAGGTFLLRVGGEIYIPKAFLGDIIGIALLHVNDLNTCPPQQPKSLSFPLGEVCLEGVAKCFFLAKHVSLVVSRHGQHWSLVA